MYRKACRLSGHRIFANHVIRSSMAPGIRAGGVAKLVRANVIYANEVIHAEHERAGAIHGATATRVRRRGCEPHFANQRRWRDTANETSSMRKRHLWLRASRMPASARAGHLRRKRHVWTAPSRQGDSAVRQADQVRSCIRPVCAVHGPLALREYEVGLQDHLCALEAR
jgi:hypothetical protein